MLKELEKFFSTPPATVIKWQDDLSPARGFLVVNSWRGGAAGGGTRIHPGCTESEVTELAKTMEIKFTVSGPEIGGAKSGIDYNFKDEKDKREILRRYFYYIQKELKTHYGTGGDQNVDQIRDVMPILRELGIRHPQEGIVRGHFSHLGLPEQEKIIDNLETGVKLPVDNDEFLRSIGFTIADVATGWGVASSLRSLNLATGSVADKKVVVEGFGNVGGAAAYFLFQQGFKIVGIIEKDWVLVDEKGLEIPALLRDRVRLFSTDYDGKKTVRSKEEQFPGHDVFVPAATSHTISRSRLDFLAKLGVKKIVCGANNPFTDNNTLEWADTHFGLLPDFVANSGMARVFSYLMQIDSRVTASAILSDISSSVKGAVDQIFQIGNSEKDLTKRAFEIALKKIKQ